MPGANPFSFASPTSYTASSQGAASAYVTTSVTGDSTTYTTTSGSLPAPITTATRWSISPT